MNIYDIDLTKLVSQGFLEDEKMRQVCEVVNTELQQMMMTTKWAKASYDVDNANKAILEHIAWQLNSELFFIGATLEEKKRLVKEAIQLHRRKGTKYAVEHAIQLIFPNAKVEEWFEYGGNPYYFRVINTERRSLREILTIISLINIMKSLRSWLDNQFEALDEGLIDLNLLFNFDTFMTASYKPNYVNSGDFITTGINTAWEVTKETQVIWIDNSNDVLPEEFSSQTFFENYLEDNNLSYSTYNSYMILQAWFDPSSDFYVVEPFPTLNDIYINTYFSNLTNLLDEEDLTEEEKATYTGELTSLTDDTVATWYIAVRTVKRFIENNSITYTAFKTWANRYTDDNSSVTINISKFEKALKAVQHYLDLLDSYLLVEDEYITEKTENATAIRDLCTKYLTLYEEDYLNE